MGDVDDAGCVFSGAAPESECECPCFVEDDSSPDVGTTDGFGAGDVDGRDETRSTDANVVSSTTASTSFLSFSAPPAVEPYTSYGDPGEKSNA